MALLTTFEGTETQAAPLTISDLFNVNDYFGLKLFGDAWNDVKRAAAIIAQRAVNAPILFYIRAQGRANSAPGKSSEAGRKLWGYNDAAGVELLGAPTWGAVKQEFDELLGWNPFSTVKKAFNYVTYPVRYVVRKAAGSGIPGISEAGKGVQYLWKAGEEFSPLTTGEKLYNVATGEGYYTEAEIKAEKQKKELKQREQMYTDQTSRASKAASEAAKAQKAYEERAAELERTMKQYGAALEPVAQQVAIAEQAKSDRLNTALWVCGGLGVFYLLTRNKK